MTLPRAVQCHSTARRRARAQIQLSQYAKVRYDPHLPSTIQRPRLTARTQLHNVVSVRHLPYRTERKAWRMIRVPLPLPAMHAAAHTRGPPPLRPPHTQLKMCTWPLSSPAMMAAPGMLVMARHTSTCSVGVGAAARGTTR